jgi:hypothetical protein
MTVMIQVEDAPSTDRLHELESWARAEYERCHPQESFDDLKRRAQFTKEDKGLLRHWLEAAARRDRRTARPGAASVESSG